jgi:hypothetical protein
MEMVNKYPFQSRLTKRKERPSVVRHTKQRRESVGTDKRGAIVERWRR